MVGNKTRRVDASGYSAPRKRKDQSQSQENKKIDWNLSEWENWLESDSDNDKESENDLDLSP